MQLRKQLPHYLSLIRFDKPIGTLLLLWPTLWALWLASGGHPNPKLVVIFMTGAFLMRSAGCILNDMADRHFDGHVTRTRERPLVKGVVSVREAFSVASLLLLIAFMLVLMCNALTVALAFMGVFFAAGYPLMKRFTHLPQLGLGVAYAWGIPMAFAATLNHVSLSVWFLFATGAVWPVMYDTLYAMVDRQDDMKIGIKSTAILFGTWDKLIVTLLQVLFLVMLVAVGLMFKLHRFYYASLMLVAFLFMYQQWLIKHRNREQCFQAFLNNNWVGLIIFAGIYLDYLR